MYELVSALILIVELSAIALFIYTIYKLIWYFIKMVRLMTKLKKPDGSVKFKSSMLDIMLHRKREFDLIVDKRDVSYKVWILSFISTHSRWNIEKDRDRYHAEARRKNHIFYKTYKHSEASEYAVEVNRESRFQRIELPLTQESDPNIRKILLIYPTPQKLTYTYTKLEYLKSGSTIEGYEIVYIEDLLCLI